MSDAFRDVLTQAGRDGAKLVMPGTRWVHRRVQNLSYLEHNLQRVRVSIDFTPPPGGTSRFLPITVLPKWPPVFRFDLRDADDRPIPLLTTEQNGIIDHALIRELAREVAPRSLENTEFTEALESLATGPDTDLSPALDQFFASLDADTDDRGVSRLADIAAVLTDSTLLWVPTPQDDERTIVKLEYVLPSSETPSSITRILRSLSWQLPGESVPLQHSGADANFHVEIEAPPVLLVRSARPRYYWLTKDPTKAKQSTAEATSDAEQAGLRPNQHVDSQGRFAHVYISGQRPMGSELFMSMAPSRGGFVLASWVATLLIAALATTFYYSRGAASTADNIDASVALLALIPALISYLVLRPNDHPLTRQYLVGVQVVLTVSAAIPVVMAILLLVYADRPHCLQEVWMWSSRASWVPFLMLGTSWLRAGQRTVG